MSGYYITELVDVLAAAGCAVAENSTTDGWQHRARSSGGFPDGFPLGVVIHHTASDTSPANDLAYMIDGSDDAPIGNVLLDRDGVYWPIAAGAANTQGKGGPCSFSRGTVPIDSGNSRLFAVEAASNGVGGRWPQVQIDAYFRGVNALNAHFGNQPTDVISHALGTGAGWTDRKIDPATADAVEGPWRPRSVTSSGTWSLDDFIAECVARAGTQPPEEPDMTDDQAHQLQMIYNLASSAWWPDPSAPAFARNGEITLNIRDIAGLVQSLTAKVDALQRTVDNL